jgi:hypothetical protein
LREIDLIYHRKGHANSRPRAKHEFENAGADNNIDRRVTIFLLLVPLQTFPLKPDR